MDYGLLMTPLMYIAAFLCVASAVVMAIPQPAVSALPRASLSGSGLSLPNGPGRRSYPWLPVLAFLGTRIPLFPRMEQAVRRSLVYTGSSLTVEEFQGLKLLSALAGGAAGVVVLREVGIIHPLWVALACVVGFVMPDAWLRSRVNHIRRAMLRLLPEVIDLLSLCVGAGLDFVGALNKVVLLKSFQREPLVQELAIALQEVKLGKRRIEALRAMARRINLPELSSFVRTFVQVDRMGTPIAEAFAIHAEDVRLQRFTRAERAALRAPIKILFPLIFCIMPCVAIIVGAPIFIQFMQQNPFGK
ncbi:MAG: type II secretion system F family protein [Candidatus Omnitrophica bacterium]|nr:type II secretion system F family protein [Candidatus Omnitrophota bacterium]